MKVVIDSSAIISILFNEVDGADFLHLVSKNECVISASNYLEAAIVVDSTNDPVLVRRFDDFMDESEIRIVEVDSKQVFEARRAYQDFGKGSGHPANLNYGDVFAYALASTTKRKLICKGNDFRKTDIAILDYLPTE